MPFAGGTVSAQVLRLALTATTYMAIFDDAKSKDPDVVDGSDQVALVLELSWAQCSSFLPPIYQTDPSELPSQVSSLLKLAQLTFARALSYQRHPEYVKTFGAEPGGKMWTIAENIMKNIQGGVQRIPPKDHPPDAAPYNIAGPVADDGKRMIVTSPDGTDNLGDF